MSKNGDGPKNGKGKLDFSKFKISSGNSDRSFWPNLSSLTSSGLIMTCSKRITWTYRFDCWLATGTNPISSPTGGVNTRAGSNSTNFPFCKADINTLPTFHSE